jgi:hypothetical protein
MPFTPQRAPVRGFYCYGGVFPPTAGANTQGIDIAFVANPQQRLAPFIEKARGITNLFRIHMPQGQTEGNTYAATNWQVLQTAVRNYFINKQWPSWVKPIVYTGSRMPLVSGSPVQDATSQAAGPEGGSQPFTSSDVDWLIENCIGDFLSSGVYRLEVDAMTTLTELATLGALDAELTSRFGPQHPVGAEALPLNFGPSGLPSDNTIDSARITQRPFNFLERNYGRTFDPLNKWRFDPTTTEVHVWVDNAFSYWTTPTSSGGAGWTQEQAVARLDDFVARGMIVDLMGDVPAYVEDWWRSQYGPKALAPQPQKVKPAKYTTKLKAVNQVLRGCRESEIDSLTGELSEEASQALSLIEEITQEVQQDGWWFNREVNKILYPDPKDTTITVPGDMHNLRTLKYVGDSDRVIQRGEKLFDKASGSYQFSAPVHVLNFVRILDWDLLPEIFRIYVTRRATREMAGTVLGDGVSLRASMYNDAEAFSKLEDEELRQGRHNAFDNPNVSSIAFTREPL